MRNSAIEDVLDGEDSIRGFLQVSLTQHKVEDDDGSVGEDDSEGGRSYL